MSEKPAVEASPVMGMQSFRERIAATISLVVIVGVFIMLGIALVFVSSPEDQYIRVMGLLSFVNPLLGVVIGYYFNKVTADSRAETAENAAKSAVATAQEATAMRQDALAEAESLQSQTKDMKSSLEEMTQWAGEMVSKVAEAPEATARTLGAAEGGVSTQDLLRLRTQGELALARARRLLNQ